MGKMKESIETAQLKLLEAKLVLEKVKSLSMFLRDREVFIEKAMHRVSFCAEQISQIERKVK